MQLYNYQIRPLACNTAEWAQLPIYSRAIYLRRNAVTPAKRLAGFYRAEIRLTTGADAHRASGSYFRYTP